ncbi:predicted protein [Postia placenta Mad-698-R]|nr:predicted protein [Postia placenta Mad-698-R]
MPPPSTLQIGDDLLPCPATPPRSQPPRMRDNQKVIPRTGAHFLTPQKRRLGGKKDQVLEIPVQEPSDASPPAKRSKRLLPDAEAHKTFDRWHALIPKLTLDHKGDPIRDPFRRGLGYATQWYDTLRHSIQHRLDAAIDAAHACLAPDPVDTLVDNHDAHALSTPPPVDALTRCARLLSTRCPACFGGAAFGRSFDEGADIHVALDATFSQCHSMHAGDSPHFYEPEFFIPKAQVCRDLRSSDRGKPKKLGAFD